MARTQPLLILLVFIAVASCASLSAQTNPETVGKHVRIAPAAGPVSSGGPFALDKSSPDRARSIQIRSEGEMTAHDRDLAADAESSIRERAGFENLGFNEGTWKYRQLVCPALPNHLFLRFSRNDGARDMSMFSAAIPRGGEGRVHIIPIVRKGYSLFSPAPIGALTIAAFNRIRSEENTDAPADWLGTGLCYAALAGANPQAGQLESEAAKSGGMPMPLTMPPTLVVSNDGGAVIRFADVSTSSHPMEWSILFDRRGKLLKATQSPAYVIRYRAGAGELSNAARPPTTDH
jgi:hypothetical protein